MMFKIDETAANRRVKQKQGKIKGREICSQRQEEKNGGDCREGRNCRRWKMSIETKLIYNNKEM